MDEVRYQITMTYTLPMLKQSIRRYCIKILGWRYFLALFFISVSLISALIAKDASWMMGALAVIFVFTLLLGICVYLNNRYYVLGTFRALKSPEITLTLYDDKFELASELGKGEWPWSAIQEIWRYTNVWLILFTRASYATLSLQTIPQEAQQFIVQKAQQAGCKIV